ncbi:MAG: AraC family ligand binding domain-containing protein [Bryobacteraceae bacterium]|jgi:glyoxylate utilization-related uncharacterized protein
MSPDLSRTTTFIDTNKLPRVQTPQGEATEILNRALAGAKNVVGTLRWLKSGEQFEAKSLDKHQLIYVMEGDGAILLENKEYGVAKGGGIYLGPSESATVKAGDGQSVKLFHLVVRKSAQQSVLQIPK